MAAPYPPTLPQGSSQILKDAHESLAAVLDDLEEEHHTVLRPLITGDLLSFLHTHCSGKPYRRRKEYEEAGTADALRSITKLMRVRRKRIRDKAYRSRKRAETQSENAEGEDAVMAVPNINEDPPEDLQDYMDALSKRLESLEVLYMLCNFTNSTRVRLMRFWSMYNR